MKMKIDVIVIQVDKIEQFQDLTKCLRCVVFHLYENLKCPNTSRLVAYRNKYGTSDIWLVGK